MKLGILIVLGIAISLPAVAQETEDLPVLDVAFAANPVPAAARWGPVGPFYPQIAVSRRRNGEVVMDCTMAADGALSKCKIVEEMPRNHDFGFAALRMAQLNYIGAPVGTPREPSRRRFRVPFKTLHPKFR